MNLLNEYQLKAIRTANLDQRDHETRLSNWALGLAGEAGEVADELKKVIHHKHDLDLVSIVAERVMSCVQAAVSSHSRDLGAERSSGIFKVSNCLSECHDLIFIHLRHAVSFASAASSPPARDISARYQISL